MHPGGHEALDLFQTATNNYNEEYWNGMSTSRILKNSYHLHHRDPDFSEFGDRLKKRLKIEKFDSRYVHAMYTWFFAFIAILTFYSIYRTIAYCSVWDHILSSLLKAYVTMGLAHSISHFQYPSQFINRNTNRIMMVIAIILAIPVEQWMHRHVILHHPDTNGDNDTDTVYPLKRTDRKFQWLWHHQYQYLYM